MTTLLALQNMYTCIYIQITLFTCIFFPLMLSLYFPKPPEVMWFKDESLYISSKNLGVQLPVDT